MRGKVKAGDKVLLLRGITPAYAGKSLPGVGFPPLYEDHPRICGEKPRHKMAGRSNLGSPPHMRGKGNFARCGLAFLGITPAYAGKRACRCCRYRRYRDHPRICGEKGIPKPTYHRHQGSPPHMRGKVIFSRRALRVSGITPAYAGKSLGPHHQNGL